jgi:threonine dehydrogenase-like Zn-dependent dehydrogenase
MQRRPWRERFAQGDGADLLISTSGVLPAASSDTHHVTPTLQSPRSRWPQVSRRKRSGRSDASDEHGTRHAARSRPGTQELQMDAPKTHQKTMIAARMHAVGEPMRIEELPRPSPGPHDVLVKVKACGIVPNLGNVLKNWTTWFPQLPLPPLPAIFGLDPTGIIEEVGSQVKTFQSGERVYVNPGRYCGSCRACREGETINCSSYTFNGYFGFSQRSLDIFKEYPYGGLAEYMLAPAYALVPLPDNVTFDQAARFGYLGTAYSAMRKLQVGPGKTVLINGISGTLGIGGALFGLAMGATRILGTGRDRALLQRVKALAPNRIQVHAAGEQPLNDWVREVTNGDMADVFVDALGPGAPHSAFLDGLFSLRRGGKAVDIGAVAGLVPLDIHEVMDEQLEIHGSCWFTAGEGCDMAEMARSGTLDLSIFEHIRYPLSEVNNAISGIAQRSGGFSNFVILP